MLNNGEVSAHDGTQSTTTKMLNFTDFIGQPSWIGPNLISAKVIMRGDLAVGNDITLRTNTILNVSGGGLPRLLSFRLVPFRLCRLESNALSVV